MAEALFWTFLGLSASSWLLYPLVLLLASVLTRRRSLPEPVEWPAVGVLLAARNEEEHIGDRILNLLDQDYPGELEVLVGSDSSTDRTDEIVSGFADRGVRLYRSGQRLGKPGIIGRLEEMSAGEVLVMTDADTVFAPDAVRRLVAPFADPRVGCVDGARVNSLDSPTSESIYWRYEKALKSLCSRLGAVLGATGAIFALRREAYEPLSPRRADDFELAAMARVRGYRCLFEERAVAEEPSPDDRRQFRRLVRISSWMSVSCVMLMGRAMASGRVGLFLQLLFHKLLRWLTGLFLVLSTATACLLAATPPYGAILAALCAFHALALAGLASGGRLPSPLSFPYVFWLMNAASLTGIAKTALGRPVETWDSSRGGDSG